LLLGCQPPEGAAGEVPPPYPIDNTNDNPLQNIFTFNGNGRVFAGGTTEGYQYIQAPSKFTWMIDVSGVKGTVVLAYLYIGRYAYDPSDLWTVIFESTTLESNTHTPAYDQDLNPYSGYYYETLKYDISGFVVQGDHTYNLTIISDSGIFLIYGASIIIICQDPSFTEAYIWLNDGCEWIYYYVTSSTTFQDLGQPDGWIATLYTYVSGGDTDPTYTDNFYFDGNLVASNPFDGSGGQWNDFEVFDVTPYMGVGSHTVDYESLTDGIILHYAALEYVKPVINEYDGAWAVVLTVMVMAIAIAIAVKNSP